MPVKGFQTPVPGFTLIELVVFIVVISVGLVGVLSVYNNTVARSADPLIQLRSLELAQAQLDEVLSRKYDTNTPVGGVPACGGTIACDAFNAADDGDCDDVDDFNSASCVMASPYPGYSISVSVEHAGTGAGSGADLTGLNNSGAAKLITVNVSGPGSVQFTLSAYRANF